MDNHLNDKKSISEESDVIKNYLPNEIKKFIENSDVNSPYKPQIKLHWGGDNSQSDTKWLSVPWDFIEHMVDYLKKPKSANTDRQRRDVMKDADLTSDEIKFLISAYNRSSGGGPVATEANYFYIVPEYAVEILKKLIIGVKLSKAGKFIAKQILAKIEGQLK